MWYMNIHVYIFLKIFHDFFIIFWAFYVAFWAFYVAFYVAFCAYRTNDHFMLVKRSLSILLLIFTHAYTFHITQSHQHEHGTWTWQILKNTHDIHVEHVSNTTQLTTWLHNKSVCYIGYKGFVVVILLRCGPIVNKLENSLNGKEIYFMWWAPILFMPE